jgi:hypothetical protein
VIVYFSHFVSFAKFNSTEFPSRGPRLRLNPVVIGFAAIERPQKRCMAPDGKGAWHLTVQVSIE